MTGDSTAVNLRALFIACLATCIIAAGCSATPPTKAPKETAITQASLVSNLHTLQTIAPQLNVLDTEFASLPRAGHETLSADDIANYYLDSDAFDFVLLVETKPDSKNNEALVFVGPEGEQRIEALMNAAK